MRRPLALWLVPALLLLTLGCRIKPIQDSGPSVVRSTTDLLVQVALTKANPQPAQVQEIRGYIVDALRTLETGDLPASVLDQIAAYLNEKISIPFVRMAIQQGIMLLKEHVAIPVDGLIPPEVKVWVVAVFEGALNGCDHYLQGYRAPASSLATTQDRISFR